MGADGTQAFAYPQVARAGMPPRIFLGLLGPPQYLRRAGVRVSTSAFPIGPAGVPCAIIPGEPRALQRLLAGEDVGTLVLAQGERLRLRQRWMLDLKARGELRVDDGARTALLEGKKSLLPSGVREVRGSFAQGDPVEIVSLDGRPFARGLAVYAADEVRRIAGLRSGEIEARLGYRLLDCVVHRDDLVVHQ